MIVNIHGYGVEIDECDIDNIMRYTWYPSIVSGCNDGYAYFRTSLLDENNNRFTILLHRLIMGCTRNDGKVIDHISGNILDNKRNNLRICTHTENMRNRKIGKNNTSGYKGVYWESRAKKWRAQIKVDGKVIKLGYSDDKGKAYEYYCEASEKYHGDFSRVQ